MALDGGCLRWITGSGAISWRATVDGTLAEQHLLSDLVQAHYRPRSVTASIRAAARSLNIVAENISLCRQTIEAIETRGRLLKATLKGLTATHAAPRMRAGALEDGAAFIEAKLSATPDARFPPTFSPSYEDVCGPLGLGQAAWQDAQRERDCGGQPLYAATVPSPSEGLALFVAQAAQAAYRAAQQRLGLVLIYQNADLTRAARPVHPLDWRVHARPWPRLNRLLGLCPSHGKPRLTKAQLPHKELEPRSLRSAFREHAGTTSPVHVNAPPPSQSDRNSRVLVSACVLNALFEPRTGIVPEFASIRAALQAKDTLSIGLYIRTGLAETNHRYAEADLRSECTVPRSSEWTWRERYEWSAPLLCAMQLEQRWAAGFQNVVWFIASDDAALRAQVQAEYDERATGGRTVLRTSGLGRHTRPAAFEEVVGGSTAFQSSLEEAFADWWLLGEADVAVLARQADSSGGAFGATAFSRTARMHSVFAPAMFAGMEPGVGPEGEPTVRLTDCGEDELHLRMF